MVRHAPIHRRSSHSDIAICCGRNVRGSSPSTSVVPLSNQVTTLNHKRFKGFKMFSDGHLGQVQKQQIKIDSSNVNRWEAVSNAVKLPINKITVNTDLKAAL